MHGITSVQQLWSGNSVVPNVAADPAAASGSVSVPSAELRELNAALPGAGTEAVTPSGGSFSGVLERAVQEVNAKQNAAAQALQGLQSGQNVTLHQVMIASEEANVSFQLMVEARNRLLESYQELMRMPV